MKAHESSWSIHWSPEYTKVIEETLSQSAEVKINQKMAKSIPQSLTIVQTCKYTTTMKSELPLPVWKTIQRRFSRWRAYKVHHLLCIIWSIDNMKNDLLFPQKEGMSHLHIASRYYRTKQSGHNLLQERTTAGVHWWYCYRLSSDLIRRERCV